MLELAISAFVTLFVVIDPVGLAPMYGALTREHTEAQRRRMACRGVIVGGLVLLGFALGGEALLNAIGVSLDAFRVAGGILLFVVAFDMVFERRTERRKRQVEAAHAADTQAGAAAMLAAESAFAAPELLEEAFEHEHEDVSVFPLAIPLIAGPGAITSTLLLTTRAGGDWVATLLVLGILALVLASTLGALLIAGRLNRLIGETAAAVISRVLGILLAALAAQFVLDGAAELVLGVIRQGA
ncbi:MarC family protein [Tistrella mobilis]|uniref:UPF0056 membrane protein n=1 Tax=Tistrella mobilis TaxID=171437 RepID=A0A162JXW0_9PROT|nr:MarC family protein [Tistrella mobilis]KYO50080.1 MarC family transcriptional regulator [Tistrella mobilis]